MEEHPSPDSSRAAKIKKHREDFDRLVKETEKELESAHRLLDKEVRDTVVELLKMKKSKDESIRLGVLKHLSKLQGLEIERHEHSGKGGAPLIIEISADHARKVREAASK